MIDLTIEAVLTLYLLSCFACLLLGYFYGHHSGFLDGLKENNGWADEAFWWRQQHEKAMDQEYLSD